jgi:two-component system, sensor histidine kinase and response regulator
VEKKSRILIVDDEVDTVELLTKRLRFEGYDTLEAYSGAECLKQVALGNPDLIILDVMMPEMDGYEVCRRLKTTRSTAYIPVLMLTAKAEVENKVKGLDVGAHDYLAKPFNYKELSARIKSLLSLKAAGEQLVREEKSDALEQVMDELAHELRNPITSIGGFARRVREGLAEGDPNRRYLDIIIQEVARLEKMVKALVELKTSGISYREPASINDLIEQILDRFRPRLDSCDIDVRTDLMEAIPPLPLDTDHMKLALGNIIENSIDAMLGMAERKLKIISRMEDGWIEIQISDTGKGIPKDKIKNIFDPFFTSKTSGPGLGLTFALRIIQEHKGAISVESEPGIGSNFTIKLPLKRT